MNANFLISVLVIVTLCSAFGTPVWAGPHVGPIVRMRPCRRAPVIDGRIEADEWRDALIMDGSTYSGANVIEPREGTLYFTFDAQYLYFGAVTEMHPEGKRVFKYEPGGAKRHNGRLDASELWVQPPLEQGREPDPYQFWVEPGGGCLLLNQKGESADGVKYRSRIGAEHWTFECAIPWKSTGYAGDPTAAGTRFLIRPTRNWMHPGDFSPIYTSWAAGWGHFDEVETMIQVICDPAAPVVQLREVGELADGRAAIRLVLRNPGEGPVNAQARIEMMRTDGEFNFAKTDYKRNWNHMAKKLRTPELFREYCEKTGLDYNQEALREESVKLAAGQTATVKMQHSVKMPEPRARRAWCYPLPRRFDVEITVVREADEALCFRRRFNLEARRPQVWTFTPFERINRKAAGYRGIWYYNQKLKNEYVYKYSGGLGTYCAKHKPFAVYAPAVEKTFFCYGGTRADSNTDLLHMVSYYDHRSGTVPRPTILLDKNTSDAHDNPVISMDDDGYIWVFSTSHGTSRRSAISRSKKPYDVSQFEAVKPVVAERPEKTWPLLNFSYMQVWHLPRQGFVCFFTRYGDPAGRTLFFMTSRDGITWENYTRTAAVEQGHYQVSAATATKAGTAFNMHPKGKGVNWRRHLYYIETRDFGKSWQSADGTPLELPLREEKNRALVYDSAEEGLLVYLKDIRYDTEGRPVILIITSKGYASGPRNDPRTWTTCRWTGEKWEIREAFRSDNNYDMGSLYIEPDGTWRIIGPTETGPQPYNPGGEMAMWISKDEGGTWEKVKQLTTGSERNHTYARRPVKAHPGFYAIWADGHGRRPSESWLWFCDKDGKAYRLPRRMKADRAEPEHVDQKR